MTKEKYKKVHSTCWKWLEFFHTNTHTYTYTHIQQTLRNKAKQKRIITTPANTHILLNLFNFATLIIIRMLLAGLTIYWFGWLPGLTAWLFGWLWFWPVFFPMEHNFFSEILVENLSVIMVNERNISIATSLLRTPSNNLGSWIEDRRRQNQTCLR